MPLAFGTNNPFCALPARTVIVRHVHALAAAPPKGDRCCPAPSTKSSSGPPVPSRCGTSHPYRLKGDSTFRSATATRWPCAATTRHGVPFAVRTRLQFLPSSFEVSNPSFRRRKHPHRPCSPGHRPRWSTPPAACCVPVRCSPMHRAWTATVPVPCRRCAARRVACLRRVAVRTYALGALRLLLRRRGLCLLFRRQRQRQPGTRPRAVGQPIDAMPRPCQQRPTRRLAKAKDVGTVQPRCSAAASARRRRRWQTRHPLPCR